MEAETYLSSGFGIRAAIESKSNGWTRFVELADVHQPNRLKGILVSPEYGTPFLTATQVFDIRPFPRKFLAIGKMATASDCFVEDGAILVTRSGSVGRPTLAHAPHRGMVISDDLLRVAAKDSRDYGWLYAYLHSAQTRAMATSPKTSECLSGLRGARAGREWGGDLPAGGRPWSPDSVVSASSTRLLSLLGALGDRGIRTPTSTSRR
jgi:hypothetical protein